MVDVHDPRETSPVLARAEQLVSDGRALEAISLLTDANRSRNDAAIETELRDLRHRAFDLVDHPAPTEPPERVRASTDEPGPLPELSAAELTLGSLRAGMASHGCVLVRGLISPTRAGRLAEGVDRALEAFDASEAATEPGAAPWYVPFSPEPGRYPLVTRRVWVRASGAVWTVDSPHMLFELTEMVAETGLVDLITQYLGERPALSARKCTLRRVPVDTDTNWHQDGAFLGQDIRTLNLWLVLSKVDRDSPGLEIVPRRLDSVLPTGTEGAIFDWSVSPAVVSEVPTEPIRPEFEAGDALLFDHLLLHRTAAGPGMTRERYAMENWFFAPSTYPEGQIPVML